MSQQKDTKTERSIKCILNLSALPWRTCSLWLCLSSDLGLEISGGWRVRQGWGSCCLPPGLWGGFSENTASHGWSSADSKSRSSPVCFRTAAPAPSSAGNAIRHVPQAPGPPRKHAGSHRKPNVHVLVRSHQHLCTFGYTHTVYKPIVLRMWGRLVCGIRGEGGKGISQQVVVSVVSLTGMWIPQKLPTSSLANIKGWLTLCVQRGCRHVRHTKKTFKKNS